MLDNTGRFPDSSEGGGFELVSTPSLLALHCWTPFWVKAWALGWTLFFVLPMAGLGPYLLWRQRDGFTVVLSAETLSIRYAIASAVDVPTAHVLGFKHIPLVRSRDGEESPHGGYRDISDRFAALSVGPFWAI